MFWGEGVVVKGDLLVERDHRVSVMLTGYFVISTCRTALGFDVAALPWLRMHLPDGHESKLLGFP
jgi:hypothetical protein